MKATWWNVHAWTSENTSSLIMSHAALLETAINYTHPPHSSHLQQPSFTKKAPCTLKSLRLGKAGAALVADVNVASSMRRCRTVGQPPKVNQDGTKAIAVPTREFRSEWNSCEFRCWKMLQLATKFPKHSCCPHSERRSAPCLVVHQRCPLHLGNHSKQFSIGHRKEGAKKKEPGSTSF